MTRDKDRLTIAPDYPKSGACGKGGDIERARLSGKPPILGAPYGAKHVSEPIEGDVYSTLAAKDAYAARDGWASERRGPDRPFSKVLMASVQSGKSVSMGDLVRGTQADAFVIGPDGERVFLDIKKAPSVERESKRSFIQWVLLIGTIGQYMGLACGILFALLYGMGRTG